ncbi:DNA helicase [Actinomyces faecalis]|uniref:DNA helicase n=1 Tax=Actinomyces faecalis TaxID=2722820 RepID=UPI0015573EA9|nr:DNA helicase [Actinomyces faecalis]
MTPSLFSFGRHRGQTQARAAEQKDPGAVSLPADADAADVADRPRTQGVWDGGDQDVVPAGGAEDFSPRVDPASGAAGGDEPEPGQPSAPTSHAHPSGRPGEAALEEALARWREELVDLGGVASLDDITLLDGVVDLTAAHPSGLAQLYAGRPTHLSSLVRERSALGVARQSLREVAGRTDLLARQFGVAPVYLALGVASWSETVPSATDDDGEPAEPMPQAARSGSDEPADGVAATDEVTHASEPEGLIRTINAPVLLRPVRLASTGGDAALTLGPSIEVNPVVTRALRSAGCRTDVDAVARASLSDLGFTPRAALTRLGSLGRQLLPDFEIHERLVVGAFVHPGQALVEDFDATVERARASALVAALAGDPDAQAALAMPLEEPDGVDRDPALERGVGDLDTAQLDAIEAVSTGASLLLDAPPGSDVAATLAAVLADAAASGRTVLHVPATGADGHAVAQALREQGLGDLVVDLTEDAGWRLHAAESIKESLGVEPPVLDVAGILATREELGQVRERMTSALQALHVPREPWGVSAYEALQHLAELTTGRARSRTGARVERGMLDRLDEHGLDRARSLLHRAHDLELLTPQTASSAWNGITVADIDQATDALSRLAELADELLPAIEDDAAQVAEQCGISRALTLTQWWAQLELLDGLRDSLDVFVPAVFERSAADMVIATATRQWREERSIEMSGTTRRRFIKQAKDLVRPGRPVEDLHGELVKVQHRREAWRLYEPRSGWPELPTGLDGMQARARRARQAVDELQPLLATAEEVPDLMGMGLPALLTRVRSLADDDVTAQKLPEINRVMGQLGELGLGELVADLAARGVEEDELDTELEYCWWTSLLAHLLGSDPDLAGLDSGVLAERQRRLRELDAAQSAFLAAPVAQACARRVRAAVEEDKEAARALYVALSRDDGVPLREILAEHPLAMVVKPVWIVPPTLVPQVLDPQALVGLAVLDASAHMPVCQVLPAFVRAEQVIVVGDPRREPTGLAAELGALLPSVTLPTTRNSLDAQIASFLATHGYSDVVEAIPSPPGAAPLSLELVDGRGMPAPGQTAVESVPAEVDRVVDLVIDHALARPEQSLGVVALNARHAEQVRRATTAAVVGSPALEEFFAGGIAEPFVVVDLSEARSLRRDHVILSVGYAKTPHGRTIHSFGSVSEPSGMVSLVEALCASRGTTQVVSCLAPQDIDPERLHAPGAQLLHQLLVRAAGRAEDDAQGSSDYPDPLLVDLAERLWRKGLTVVPRYGLEGGTRIPLAIGHPDYPGELLVAVLTDDAEYVAEKSLRRRDRHWVERLERRGWRVYTAFSVSVFIDPEAEATAIENEVLAVLSEREAERRRAEQVAAAPLTGLDTEAAQSGSDPGEVDQDQREREPVRGLRPPIAQGLPLQAYSDDQLDDLVAWIRSDGVERSIEAEVEELRATLALLRRGSGVDAVLTHAVTRTRAQADD